MEELQTTEALDKEILEDARKKAFKILKSADDTIDASKASWNKKLERSQNKTRLRYSEKEEQLRGEIMTRLPMDKRRARSKTIDHFLNKAMEDFLASLDRQSTMRIMEKELEKRKAEIASKNSGDFLKQSGKIPVRYRNLSKEQCGALVGSSFPSVSFTYNEDPLHVIAGSSPALVIDFPHLRITVSVDRAAEALLLDKRAELAAALLGDMENG